MTDPAQTLLAAERELFALYGIEYRSRRVRLADPDLEVRVLGAGDGEALVLVHGSGMSAATWAPLIAQLRQRRVIAVDLPGFGLSDGLDYRGRTLREHAVAQLSSLLDALEFDEAELAGNSLGAMWALCLAQAAPERATRVTVYGVPAVSLPGVKANAFFRLASTPGLGRLILRVLDTPVRFVTGSADVYGLPAIAERAAALMPDATVEVIDGAGHAPFLDGAYAYS